MMKQCFSKGLLAATILAAPMAFSSSANAQTFEEALSASKPMFNVVLRYEGVDQDGAAQEADALTARIRAGLETGEYKSTKFLIDFDYTEALIDDYAPETAGFPVVADPEVVELNRFQFTNTSLPDTKVTLGRQRIIHPGARFIGNVGWRQDEQTYDALRIENSSFSNFKIDISYVDQINRIFGDGSSSAAGTAPAWNSDSWLLRGSSTFAAGSTKISLSPFAYLLDLENTGLSTETYGIEAGVKSGIFSGKAKIASQSDYGDNPTSFDAPYYMMEAGVAKSGFSGAIGYEVLGSDNGAKGFTTPLATLHAYNGFADKFLVTPAQGLQDLYVKAGYKMSNSLGALAPISFTAWYHDYSADEGTATYDDYGSEINFAAGSKIGKVGLLLKYADYSADDHATDTSKIWLQTSYSF